MKVGVSLNTHLVFVTQGGELKVIHNDLFDQGYRYNYDSKYFYPPEKMLNFNRFDSEASLAKGGVFSIGMSVLQAALLKESMDCYDP